MKPFAIAFAALALISVAGSSFAATAMPRAHRRHVRQEMRITQGVRSGRLTARETMRLERGQARVEREMWRARTNGSVSFRERARIARAQDWQSRRIYRLKHNRKGC
jgi:hypothetical protein